MEKINLKPLIIIILLILGVLGWRSFGGKILPKSDGYLRQLGIKKEAVIVISLSQKDKSLEIKKEEDAWRIEGKKAKEVQVSDLLGVIFPEKEPELVAKTSSRHKEMKVDEENAIKIKLNGEKEIWLGTAAGGNYLRFPGKDEVWLVSSSWFSPTVDFSFWADKTIISLDSSRLKKLEFHSSSKIKVFERKEGSWWQGEEKIEDQILEPVINTLSPLIAEEVVKEGRPAGYPQAPTVTLKIEWDGGEEKLEFFKGSKDWLVKRNSDGEEFLVGEEVGKKFLF